MGYSQHSSHAYSGDVENIKHRVSSNSNAPSSEQIRWPEKFDLFTNKENSSSVDFSVVESHAPADLVGSTLYLDHRPASDMSGNFGSFTPSDGVIDTGSIDVFNKSIVFSTLPTANPFTVSYTARADKIEDSHVNALQNAVMELERVVGLKTPITGAGSGVATLPILISTDIGELTEMQSIQDYLPNAVFTRHLQDDLQIGSTDDSDIPVGNVTITLGATGSISRDSIIIDADSLTVQATNTANPHSLPSGTFIYSSNTGDYVGFSGVSEFASQVTIGKSYGALIDSFNDTVPGGDLDHFYNQAALRVHGGLWFNSGISGVGSIVFITTTGESVQVVGGVHATTLLIDSTATFNGTTNTVNGEWFIQHPGFLRTSNDITMTDKPDGTHTKIDGLDASYAAAAIDHHATIKGVVDSSVRHSITEQHGSDATGNPGYNIVHHPQLGFDMYPVLRGWTFTGLVNFEKAQSGQHHNIILLDCEIDAVGFNHPSDSTKSHSLGGGSNPWGSYCTGLFNPGDTWIEFNLGNGDSNKLSYPIYYHTPEALEAGQLTGVNVYIAADDDTFEDGTVLTATEFRLYQPGNVPLDHLQADGDGSFNTATAPVVEFGNQTNSDYPNTRVSLLTEEAWDGGNAVDEQRVLHKRLNAGSVVSVDLTDAFTKSLDGYSPSAASPGTGVAYVFATSRPGNTSTDETTLVLRATPTPYGLASQMVYKNGFNMQPGQHCPVGEVWASTTNGTSWTHVETVSYRTDGFYDSGWVPMVEYLSDQSATPVPQKLGRCLPIFESLDGGSNEHATSEGDMHFWVEHNLGPVRGGMTDFEFKVWIASYKEIRYTDPQQSDLFSRGQSVYKQTAAGDMNLWSPFSMPYHASHERYSTFQGGTAAKGELRDMTEHARIKMVDSRFAQVSFDGLATTIEGQEYIRVYVRRIR